VIESLVRLRLFLVVLRLFFVILKVLNANQWTLCVTCVHGLVALSAGESVVLAATSDLLYCSRKPWGVTGAQSVSIKSLGVAHAPGLLASISQINRNRIVRMAGLHPYRKVEVFAVLHFDPNHVHLLDVHTFGHRRAH